MVIKYRMALYLGTSPNFLQYISFPVAFEKDRLSLPVINNPDNGDFF